MCAAFFIRANNSIYTAAVLISSSLASLTCTVGTRMNKIQVTLSYMVGGKRHQTLREIRTIIYYFSAPAGVQ